MRYNNVKYTFMRCLHNEYMEFKNRYKNSLRICIIKHQIPFKKMDGKI